jgi:nitroreductase
MESKSSVIFENIHNRKSVRHYNGKPADKEQLLQLIKAGMAAPSAKNIQPWAFIGITDAKTLETLAAELPFAKMLPSAGSAIVVCGDLIKASEESHPDMWAQDCSAATENILLGAEALGLGAVWTACWPHRIRSAYVASVLGVPEHIVPFCVIAIGHSTGEDLPINKFQQDNIRWEKW